MEVNYPGVIVRGAIILVPIIRGQFFWGSLFGGNYPGAIILVGNYPGGNCPGDNCLWGNYPGGNCPGAIVLEPFLREPTFQVLVRGRSPPKKA